MKIYLQSSVDFLIEKGEFHWSFGLQFIFGFVIVILNGLGKMGREN